MRWGPILAGVGTLLGLTFLTRKARASVVPPGFDDETGAPLPGPGVGVPGAVGGPTRISAAAAEEIARHEGIQLHLYNDPSNICTVGIGHKLHDGPCNGSEAVVYRKGGIPAAVPNAEAPRPTLTRQEALDLFQADLRPREQVVVNAVTVPLTQNQFDALVSLVFNIGGGNFRSSTLLRRLNEGSYALAAEQFHVWRRSGGKVLPGLVARRAWEAELFQTA